MMWPPGCLLDACREAGQEMVVDVMHGRPLRQSGVKRPRLRHSGEG